MTDKTVDRKLTEFETRVRNVEKSVTDCNQRIDFKPSVSKILSSSNTWTGQLTFATPPLINSIAVSSGSNPFTSYTVSSSISSDTSISNEYDSQYDYYLVDTSSSTVTVTLPEISTIDVSGNKRLFIFVDETGSFNTNNLTLQCSGSDTINGSTTYTAGTAYMVFQVIAMTNKWYVNR